MAQGLYAQTSDVQNQFGVNNVATWSQLDNAQGAVLNDSRVQAGFNITDAYIISTFSTLGNYTTPLIPLGTDVQLVLHWSAVLCGEWLYFSRGIRDKDTNGDKISKLADQVRSEMFSYRSSTDKLNAARRWPTATSPVGY